MHRSCTCYSISGGASYQMATQLSNCHKHLPLNNGRINADNKYFDTQKFIAT